MGRELLVGLLLAGLLVACRPRASESGRPNLLLILADDLGYSDLGCFGGEIRTPNLDRLAANGLRLTQLYTSARCCPTRASLLTGLYPHRAGVGAMSADNGLPGYRGFLNDRCRTLPEVLKPAGYRTYLAGKWHLRGKGNPECTPLNRGFDEFYGHYRAYASFFRPDLYVREPKGRTVTRYDRDSFYATDAITDHALQFIQEARGGDAPFFLYLSYNAPHFPLHAPKDAIDAYVETYSKGWDAVRTSRLTRMHELGILPRGVMLSPRGHVTKVPERNLDSPYYDKQIPAWNTLSKDRRKDLARRMATYAAMVEIMDRNIGRVVDALKAGGELDNTLVVFLSDNGACAEWDPLGFDANPYPKNILHAGADLERIGAPGSFNSYGTGWANACNTPFRLYKHYTHEGGISTPAIVHWPSGMRRRGEIDRQPAHVIDLTATLLAAGQADYPDSWEGKPIHPLAGQSLLPVLEGHRLPDRPLFFEHEGNRAVRMGKWKAVWTNFTQAWELYDIVADRSERKDLAPAHPGQVKRLDAMWRAWAADTFVASAKIPQPAKGMPKIYYFKN